MFVLADNLTFMHTVPVQVPTDAGHTEQTMRVRFAVRGDEEIAKFNLNDRESTVAFLKLVVVGFDDVVAADGNPVAYSAETRDRVLDLPFVRLALVKGYYAGMFKAQTGN